MLAVFHELVRNGKQAPENHQGLFLAKLCNQTAQALEPMVKTLVEWVKEVELERQTPLV